MAEPKKTKGADASSTPFDWSQSQASGFENVGREDLGIPFLMIVQKGSPEVDPDHKDYATKKIPGAKVGDIVNTLKREVIFSEGGDPIQFVPCTYEKLMMEWTPRDKGGGMVKAHRDPSILNQCSRNEKGQDVLPNGNLIVTTAYFYGLLVTKDGERIPSVIGLSSTQLKKARMWLNLMTTLKLDGPRGRYTPPMFSHMYLLSTVPERNEKGNWRGWKIDRGSMLQDPPLIADAMEYSKRAASISRGALPPPPAEDDVPMA